MIDSSFFVYVHKRIGSGVPFYVGKGRRARAYSLSGRNAYWKRIVQKDGGRNIELIAQEIDEEFALLVETEVIDKYRRLGARLVNLTDGGDGTSGYKMSDQTKKIIAAKATGRVPSETARTKMSAAQKGRPKLRTAIHQAALSAAALASHLGKPSPLRGRTHSEDTKQKMREAHKSRKPDSAETREKKRQANIGRVYSAESIAKMSASRKAWHQRKKEIAS